MAISSKQSSFQPTRPAGATGTSIPQTSSPCGGSFSCAPATPSLPIFFHARIRETLKNRALIRPEKLEEFIGIRYFELLFPTVNAYPALNINLVDPWILKQLLAYPAFRVVAPAASAENLVGLRQSRPIAGDELFSLIAVDEGDEGDAETEGNYLPKEENRLFAYLGSVTWFWEIKVSRDTRTLRRVIAPPP